MRLRPKSKGWKDALGYVSSFFTLVIRDMSFFRPVVTFPNRGSATERPKISVTLNALKFAKIAATGILSET